MDERTVQFRVGVMVVATLLITAILVLLMGDPKQIFQGTYTIHIEFTDAPGVSAGTPVRSRGLLIGRVADVAFSDEGVIVTADIHEEVELRRNQRCKIAGSLFGDRALEFVSFQDERLRQETVEPGETIQGEVSGEPLSVLADMEDDIREMMEAMTEASRDVSTAARRLNALVDDNDEQIDRIVDKTERALDSLTAASQSVNEVLGDPELRENLNRTLADLPLLFDDTRQAVAAMSNTFERMDRTLDSADRNLHNLEGFTRPLGERGEEFFDKIDRGTQKIDVLLNRLIEFSESLNSREGSFGRLLNDPVLYENLSSAAANIEELTRDLKPIVRDARVFSDKIARHPEILGVRGAIHQSSGAK